MKKYGEQLGIDMQKIENEIEKEKKFEKKLIEQKDKFKKNIDTLSQDARENNIGARRTTIQARRTSKLADLRRLSKNSQGNQMEMNFQIQKGIDNLIENIFTNVNVQNMQKHTKGQSDQIADLQNEIEQLKQNLKEEKDANMKMKLKHFVMGKAQQSGGVIIEKEEGNVETQKKSVKIQDEQIKMNIPPSMTRESMASMKTLQEPKTMLELKQDVFDLMEISINHMKDNMQYAKKPEKVQERIDFLEKSKTVLNNIFKVLNLIHNSKKDFDNGMIKNMELFNEEFDFQLLKERYEAKIKTLVDYIKKIRDNNDFFNFSVDNNVLTA
jgi:hypothetical protein